MTDIPVHSDRQKLLSHRHGGSSIARLGRLCLKEIRECIRDRRTIVTLVLMPLIVYPILSIVFQRFLLSSDLATARPTIVIAVTDDDARAVVEDILLAGHEVVEQDPQFFREPQVQLPGLPHAKDEPPQVLFHVTPEAEEAIREGMADVAIRVHRPNQGQERELSANRPTTGTWDLLIRPNSLNSQRGLAFIRNRVEALNLAILRQRLQNLGASSQLPTDMRLSYAAESNAPPMSYATVIPLMLILMTMAGAVYPAIDTTAGERERGTLEALIATPVPRFALLTAKYLSVVTVSVLTATANLLAMTVTIYCTGLGKLVLGEDALSLSLYWKTFWLLTLFAFFFSSVVLAVASVARSFKEAQAYLIPLILVSLGPSLMSLAPGFTLGPGLSVTPLINMVLLARDVFDGRATSYALLVVISTVLYSIAAIGLAARVFGSDAVLYGSQLSWSDLFVPPSEARPSLSSLGAVFVLALILPFYILGASFLVRSAETSFAKLLWGNAVLTVILFGCLPTMALVQQRVALKQAFVFRSVPWQSWCGALLIGVCAWLVIIVAVKPLAGHTWRPDQWRMGKELIDQFRQVPLPWLLVSMALVPAIFEELFFRGFLLSAFLRDSTPRNAILVTAFLFGLFHVLTGTLATERLMPSTVLGLLLGWICWRSKSILPGILAHGLHNAILLSIAHQRPVLERHGWTEISMMRICGGAALALFGVVLGAWMISRKVTSS